jgi:hypothetical protein
MIESERTEPEAVYQILSDIRDETFRTTFATRAIAKFLLLGATYGVPAALLLGIGVLSGRDDSSLFLLAALSLALLGLIHTLSSSWSQFRKSHFW